MVTKTISSHDINKLKQGKEINIEIVFIDSTYKPSLVTAFGNNHGDNLTAFIGTDTLEASKFMLQDNEFEATINGKKYKLELLPIISTTMFQSMSIKEDGTAKLLVFDNEKERIAEIKGTMRREI